MTTPTPQIERPALPEPQFGRIGIDPNTGVYCEDASGEEAFSGAQLLFYAATVSAPLRAENEAQAKRIAELEAALDYHSAHYYGRLPAWVPVRVHLPAEVFGDPPFRGKGAAAGEHACQCNQHGAVSVVDRGGKLLGLRPAEFRVLEWRQAPSLSPQGVAPAAREGQ